MGVILCAIAMKRKHDEDTRDTRELLTPRSGAEHHARRKRYELMKLWLWHHAICAACDGAVPLELLRHICINLFEPSGFRIEAYAALDGANISTTRVSALMQATTFTYNCCFQLRFERQTSVLFMFSRDSHSYGVLHSQVEKRLDAQQEREYTLYDLMLYFYDV